MKARVLVSRIGMCGATGNFKVVHQGLVLSPYSKV